MAERAVIANPFEGQVATVGATARPVDIYQKAQVKKGGWQALEQSLNAFSQKALPAIGRIEQQSAEREYAEGQKLWSETRINIGEAVKKGIIAEGESPYLQKGYRAANLNVLSANYATDLAHQMEKRKLYHNGNPEKIEEFITQFQADYVDKNGFDNFNDVETAEFFLPNAMKANTNFKQSWREKHTAYMTTKIYEGFRDKISAYTYSLVDPKLTKDQRTKAAAGLQAFIQGEADQAEIDGLDRLKVGTAIADALRLSALETNSFAPLQFMGQIRVGKGSLAGTFDARQKNQKVRVQIMQNIDRQEQRDRLNAEIEETEAREAISASASEELPLLGSSAAPIRRGAEMRVANRIKELRDMGDTKSVSRAEALENLVIARQAAFEKGDVTDETAYATQLIKIKNESDPEERLKLITEGLTNGAFTTDAHINKALSLSTSAKGTAIWTALNETTGPVQRQWNNWEETYLGIPKAGRSTRRNFEVSQKQLLASAAIRNELDDYLTLEINSYKASNDGQFPSADFIAGRTASKLRDLTGLYASEVAEIGEELMRNAQRDGKLNLTPPRKPTQRPESAIKNPDGDGTVIRTLKWGWDNLSGLVFDEPEGNPPVVVVTPAKPKTSDIPD